MPYEQRTIEYFFQEGDVQNADEKAKLLPVLTPMIYRYNQYIIEYEKETDEYRKKQIEDSLQEITINIGKIIKDVKSGEFETGYGV